MVFVTKASLQKQPQNDHITTKDCNIIDNTGQDGDTASHTEIQSCPTPTLKRVHLLKQLNLYISNGVTLISAKSGFGKSTLIDQIINNSAWTNFHHFPGSKNNHVSNYNSFNNIKNNVNNHTNDSSIDSHSTHSKDNQHQLRGHLPHDPQSVISKIHELIAQDRSTATSANPKQNSTNPRSNTDPHTNHHRLIIALDDYHLYPDDFTDSLVTLLKTCKNRFSLVISTQETPPQALLPFFTSTQSLLLTEDQLKLNRYEIRQLITTYAKQSAPLASLIQHYPSIEALVTAFFHDTLDGWPKLVTHALNGLHQMTPARLDKLAAKSFIECQSQLINQLKQTSFDCLDQHLFNGLTTFSNNNHYIQTALYPTLTHSLINRLSECNQLLPSINELCRLKLLKYSKNFNSEVIDAHPILRSYRLNKWRQCHNTELETKIDPTVQWYSSTHRPIEAISLLAHQAAWLECFKALESNFLRLQSEGQWHGLRKIIALIPVDIWEQYCLHQPASTHLSLLADVTLALLINQQPVEAIPLLALFLNVDKTTLRLSLEDSANRDPTDVHQAIKIDYLQRYAENISQDTALFSSCSKPLFSETLYSESNENELYTTLIENKPFLYSASLPKRIDNQRIPELAILESLRLIHQSHDLTAGFETIADALEASLSSNNRFLTLHTLLIYIYHSEQLGELNSLQTCCTQLQAWSQSQHYCHVAFSSLLRALGTAWLLERAPQQQLREEILAIEMSMDMKNLFADPLIELIFYRSLHSLYVATGMEERAETYQHKLQGIWQVLPQELSSLAGSPEQPTSSLPPFELDELIDHRIDQYQQKKTAHSNKTTNTSLDKSTQKRQGTSKTLHELIQLLSDIEAISFDKHLMRTHLQAKCQIAALYHEHQQAPELIINKLQEAFSIMDILGHRRLFHKVSRSLFEWSTQKFREDQQYGHLVESIETLCKKDPQTSTQEQTHSEELIDLLSKREKEVITLAVEGLSNEEIADKLHRSIGTIKLHIHNAYKKLQVKNRMEAIQLFKALLTSAS